MLKKWPGLLWGILLVLVFYDGNAYVAGKDFWAHTQSVHHRKLLEYWGWMCIGSRFLMFLLGFSGIAWMKEGGIRAFLSKSFLTALSFFVLQLAVAFTVLPDIPVPLINEKGFGWDDVESGTFFILNSGWALAGLLASWAVYGICRKRTG